MSGEPVAITVVGDPTSTDHPRVLVHALTGFLDAGGAPSLAADHLIQTNESSARILATFDSDLFVDYRARRPAMTFERNHYGSVVIPEIVVRELRDTNNRPFLLMTGPEPDFAWNRFVATVLELAADWRLDFVVGLGAIPWPAPHTRPLDVTAHATDEALISGYRSWVDMLQIPGHLPGLLELRLGEAGFAAYGFAVHVPQYLAQYRYPRAAIRLLRAVSESTQLAFSYDGLDALAVEADKEIAAYLEGSQELRELVEALEARYEAMHATPPEEWSEQNLPSGDEIAAALQAFLADQPGSDDPPVG